MDHFDSKVNQMKLDIDKINKEIKEIQKVINNFFIFKINHSRKTKGKKEIYQIQ